MIGDGHMAGIGALADKDDTVLPELAIRTAIFHIGRHIECILRPRFQILNNGLPAIQFH